MVPIGGGFVDGLQLPRTITPLCTDATDRQAGKAPAHDGARGLPQPPPAQPPPAQAPPAQPPPAQAPPAQGGGSSSSSSLEGLLQRPRCVAAGAAGRLRPRPNPNPGPNPNPNPKPSP